MSTKQNDRLLLLLQQEEQKGAALAEELAAAHVRQREVVVLYRKLLAHTAEREAADAPFVRDSSALVESLGASQVSVLLYTVTFYANLAHSLTRSP